MSEIPKYGFDYFRIQDPENSLQIKLYQSELENSRVEDMKCIMNSVSKVRRDFETLRFEVCNLTKNQSTDYLRKQMYLTEDNITRLKKTVREELSTLFEEEVKLTTDIHFIQKRISEWEKLIDVRIFKPIKQSKYQSIKTDDENPTKQFQNFLSRSGGHYGGWEERDHLLFLKERTKHKGKDKFIVALQYLLPDLSSEEIANHEKWYQKYESLKNSQKDAIRNWRSEKETQEKKDKEKEESKKEKAVKRPARQQFDIADRIKEWKKQQKLKKLEEEERQKKEKEKLKAEEKRKKELQEMKKLAIRQYKAEKLSKIQAIFPKTDKTPAQEANAKSKILLKAFRLQDLKFIEKKKIIQLQIESKSSEKFDRLKLEKPALEFIFQRNPQRIFQPTFIWNQHCSKAHNKEKAIPTFDLNSIPRLAIPEWRRELK